MAQRHGGKCRMDEVLADYSNLEPLLQYSTHGMWMPWSRVESLSLNGLCSFAGTGIVHLLMYRWFAVMILMILKTDSTHFMTTSIFMGFLKNTTKKKKKHVPTSSAQPAARSRLRAAPRLFFHRSLVRSVSGLVLENPF